MYKDCVVPDVWTCYIGNFTMYIRVFTFLSFSLTLFYHANSHYSIENHIFCCCEDSHIYICWLQNVLKWLYYFVNYRTTIGSINLIAVEQHRVFSCYFLWFKTHTHTYFRLKLCQPKPLDISIMCRICRACWNPWRRLKDRLCFFLRLFPFCGCLRKKPPTLNNLFYFISPLPSLLCVYIYNSYGFRCSPLLVRILKSGLWYER